jgi:hypothetical protein
MSSSTDRQSGLMALITNPLAAVRTEGASLPPPVFDPCPKATNILHGHILHGLWQKVRPFCGFGPNAPSLSSDTTNTSLTVARAFKSFGDDLVSAFQIFLL